MDVRAWFQSYWRMKEKNLTCWKSGEKYSYNVFISQKQHSSSRACEGKDVLKCAWMWPKWFVLWDLSLFLFTPQFIKKTLQWAKNPACLDAVGEFGKKTLSDRGSFMFLEQQLVIKGILHFILTQILSILCSLSPEMRQCSSTYNEKVTLLSEVGLLSLQGYLWTLWTPSLCPTDKMRQFWL